MSRVDFLASEVHFLDHLALLWKALPEPERGQFRVLDRPRWGTSARQMLERAASLGIEVVEGSDGLASHVVTASVGDLRRARNAGAREVALLEHGSGQSFGGDAKSARQTSYPGGARRDASLFISPNAHAAGRDAAAYPLARTAVVGCPKLDTLPERSQPGPDGPVIAVSFHWECMVCAETRSGWREFRAAIAALVGRYHIIGHGHPRAFDELAREYRRLRIEPVRDFRDVVARAHVYVNEGSSTLFEAAAAGIPVVVLQPRGFRPHVNHGLRFESDGHRYVGAAHVGPTVLSRGTWDWKLSKLLGEAIDEALADPPERVAARERALDIVYAHRTGAAERAAEAVLSWAAEPVEAVA